MKTRGYCCPDQNVEGGPVAIDGEMAIQECKCTECGEEWIDHYGLLNPHFRVWIYEYKVWPVSEVIAIMRAKQEVARTGEGFVSEDSLHIEILEAEKKGFRWVRTECEMAIFERPTIR